MRPRRLFPIGSAGLPVLLALAACGKQAPTEAPAEHKAAASASAPLTTASASPTMPTLAARSVKATFLIDAPLEKIKGVAEEGEGNVSIVPNDLAKTTGMIKIKLSSLKTQTFGDKGKDESQTEHARAWMEVGKDTPEATRRANEQATFTLRSLKGPVNDVAAIKEENGERKATLTAAGDLKLHGVTVRRDLVLVVTFKGPADAPTEVSVKTEAPFAISLKEHDIRPRDGIGKFLDGALEKIGKKIDDKVQLSLEASFAR
jgi:polyisoprenoid-binding protein YceI